MLRNLLCTSLALRCIPKPISSRALLLPRLFSTETSESIKKRGGAILSEAHRNDPHTLGEYIQKLKSGELNDYTDEDWKAGYLVFDESKGILVSFNNIILDGLSFKNLGFDGENFFVIEWGVRSEELPDGYRMINVHTEDVEKNFDPRALKYMVRNHFKLQKDAIALGKKFTNQEDILKDPEGLENIVGKSRAEYMLATLKEARDNEKKNAAVKNSGEKEKDWQD